MKTTLYIAALLSILQICPVSGQHFAPIGATWYYSSSAYGAAPVRSEYYLMTAEKDSVMSGYALRKIKRTHYRYQGDSVEVAPYWLHQAGDTVSMYRPGEERLYKLFIFNAVPGDTLTLDIPHEAQSGFADMTYRVIVDSVLTELYDGVPLRKYVLESLDHFGWNRGFYLEKVGGYEWFLPLGITVIPEADGPIRCYRDDEVDIHFSALPCDYRVVSSVQDWPTNRTTTLFPNPASDYVQIESDIAPARIEVYDRLGRLLFTTDQNPFTVSHLKSGVYFVQTYAGDGMRVVKRLVKR